MKVNSFIRPICMIAMTLHFQFATGAEKTAASMPQEDKELRALELMLDEETRMATREHLNADYVPGMISILHGDDLLSQGFNTVFDALSVVPGVQTTRGNRGTMRVLIRGMQSSLFGGNVQIMLNSVPMISSAEALATNVLTLPIGVVDRIEVIRGPGSSEYGEYSLVGSVNVITRKKNTGLFVRAASFDSYEAGGNFSWSDENSDLHLYGNFSGWDTDGDHVNSGADFFTSQGAGYAPGPVDDREGNRSIILGMKKDGFSASLFWSQYDFGNFFGVRSLGAPDPDKGRNEQWSLNLHQQLKPREHLDVSFEFNAMDMQHKDNEHGAFPAGAILPGPPPSPMGPPPLRAPYDLVLRSNYSERRYDVEAKIKWSGWEGHQVTATAEWAHVDLYDSSLEANFIIGPPLTVFSSVVSLRGLELDEPRRVRSFIIQDQWSPSPSFSITAGLRHDDYNDVGSHTSPRLSAIWQFHPQHALKAQYTHALRPPTFFELYADPTMTNMVELQLQKSTEIGYIYRTVNTLVRATIFDSKITSPTIGGARPDSYVTGESISTKGLELEGEFKLGDNWQLGANLSYLDSDDNNYGSDIRASYEWLSNLFIEGDITPNLQINARLHAVSKQTSMQQGVIDSAAPYHTLDVALTKSSFLGNKDLTLRGGVNNLFDEEIRFAASPRTYVDNLPQPGRMFWVHASYDFD